MIPVRADAAEDILDLLLDLAPQGVREHADGDVVEFVIYGAAPSAAELRAAAGDALVRPVAIDDVAGGWPERRARESRPLVIAGRIHLRRPWDPPAGPGLIDLVIDRGRGFGTGGHPTTAMVLELMCDLEPAGALVDLGCGAGVLSIAAAKLGWSSVTGVDIDETAVAEARANIERNAAGASVEHADLTRDPMPAAEVALANVNPLEVHAIIATRLPADVRTLVASGLVTEEVGPALGLYARAALTEVRRLERDGWAAVVLGRPA